MSKAFESVRLVPEALVKRSVVAVAFVTVKEVPVDVVKLRVGKVPYPETVILVPEVLVKFKVVNRPYPEAVRLVVETFVAVKFVVETFPGNETVKPLLPTVTVVAVALPIVSAPSLSMVSVESLVTFVVVNVSEATATEIVNANTIATKKTTRRNVPFFSIFDITVLLYNINI